MGAFMHTPWGFLGWGLDWLAHSGLFNHNDYFTHSNAVARLGLSRTAVRAPIPATRNWLVGLWWLWCTITAGDSYGRQLQQRLQARRFAAQPNGYARPSEGFNR